MTETEYVIVEVGKIKAEYPEFEKAVLDCYDAARKKAESIWAGYKASKSLFPKDGEFGETTLLPKFLRNRAGSRLGNTFRQSFASTGWNDIWYDGGNKSDEDIVLAIPGIAFLSPVMNVADFRFEISDVKFPRLNLEEMQGLVNPAVIFKEGIVISEKTGYRFRGYFEATGYQRIVPLKGLTLFKKKDDVIPDY
ncbi:MAG: hypothetical protein AB1420_15780 [Bacillota bacterium]